MWIVGKILDQYFNRWLFWWGISTKPANLFFLQAGCYPEDTFKTQIQTRKGDKFSGKMALSKNVGPRHPKTWLVVWNMVFIFPFSWECHHPNWLSLIFFRGVGQPPYIYTHNIHISSPTLDDIYGPEITWTASPTMGIHDGETMGIQEAEKPTSLYTKEQLVTCKYEP